jgi:hypothetical protein
MTSEDCIGLSRTSRTFLNHFIGPLRTSRTSKEFMDFKGFMAFKGLQRTSKDFKRL